MGQLSQSGQIGFKTQGSKGTYATPGTGGVFMRHRSGALGGARELMIPDPEIGGSRDIAGARLGPVIFSGEIESYARFEALATLLTGALGSASSSDDAGTWGPNLRPVGTHTITPIDTVALPWLSVEEAIGDSYEYFNYTDARVNTFSLEAEADGYLMCTAGLLALSQQASGTGGTATKTDLSANADLIDVSPLIVGSEVTVDWGGSNLAAKSVSFEITNNIEDDDFVLGSVFAGDATPKRREMTCGLTIRPEDSDMWREAMYGSSDDTTVVDASSSEPTSKALDITITSVTEIGASGTPFSITMSAPVATIAPFEVEPSGDDVIEHDLEVRIFRPDSAVDAVTFTVVNNLATVA